MDRASVTAMGAAFGRAYHSKHGQPPKIFDDFLAERLFTIEELSTMGPKVAAGLRIFNPEAAAAGLGTEDALAELMRTNAPIALCRARFAEDHLKAGAASFRRYTLLGAGLDTFGFRRPEWAREIEVVEVDHPATLALKRDRIALAGWEEPRRWRQIASHLPELGDAPFEPPARTLFNWMGVTYYLPRPAVDAVLRAVATRAPSGSAVVFDYFDPDAFVPGRAALRMQRMQDAFRQGPEPLLTGLDPARLPGELRALGLTLEEDLAPPEIQKRYFRARTDGYRAYEHVHLARAVVP